MARSTSQLQTTNEVGAFLGRAFTATGTRQFTSLVLEVAYNEWEYTHRGAIVGTTRDAIHVLRVLRHGHIPLS
jgi:hypothetical protein